MHGANNQLASVNKTSSSLFNNWVLLPGIAVTAEPQQPYNIIEHRELLGP